MFYSKAMNISKFHLEEESRRQLIMAIQKFEPVKRFKRFKIKMSQGYQAVE